MTLKEALQCLTPGEVIRHGKEDEYDFVEIFVLQDGTLRFSDQTMEINSKNIGSDKWEK